MTDSNIEELKNKIELLWRQKNDKSKQFNLDEVLYYSEKVIDLLDCGKIRVAEYRNNSWIVNQWIKQAILLSFLRTNKLSSDNTNIWFDKCSNKFENWNENSFKNANIRAVNGCFVRKGSFFFYVCVIMPSFVNIGAYVGENTMIDSMSTIGSCCQIGKNCHISANVCIGGVLEPLQSNPVIIEDDCFIGAGSVITEGMIVGKGSVVASGVILTSSVKIIDRQTNEVIKGIIPPYSVVVPGSYCSKENKNLNINCAIIIKKITKDIREKTSINELLR